MKEFWIMDGRAQYAVDAASIVEVFRAPTVKAAKKYLRREYDDMDMCLVDPETHQVIY